MVILTLGCPIVGISSTVTIVNYKLSIVQSCIISWLPSSLSLNPPQVPFSSFPYPDFPISSFPSLHFPDSFFSPLPVLYYLGYHIFVSPRLPIWIPWFPSPVSLPFSPIPISLQLFVSPISGYPALATPLSHSRLPGWLPIFLIHSVTPHFPTIQPPIPPLIRLFVYLGWHGPGRPFSSLALALSLPLTIGEPTC